MTKFLGLLVLAMFVTSAEVHAEPLPTTHRVFSTDPLYMPLPSVLNFQSTRLEIASAGWFNSLFETDNCEKAMTAALPGILDMKVTGEHSIDFSWRGKKSFLMQKAYASYIPTHYRFGQPVPAHTLITIPGFVILHVSIKSEGGVRSMHLSLVRRDPARGLKLEPILIAHEL